MGDEELIDGMTPEEFAEAERAYVPMTADEKIEQQIVMSAFVLRAHPEADIEAVLRLLVSETRKLLGENRPFSGE